MTIGAVAIFSPYSFVRPIPAVIQVPWEDPDHEAPKAVIQFTFTSKGAFTVNYPIHVKVEIWFREGINHTNVIVHILNPPAQAFKYPLSDPPDAGLIRISEVGNPRVGELDVIFTSQGPFGFVVFSGMLPEITNMTVAYVINYLIILSFLSNSVLFGLLILLTANFYLHVRKEKSKRRNLSKTLS